MTKNEVYITKQRKVLTPATGTSKSITIVKAMAKNLQALGFKISKKLADQLSTLTAAEIGKLYQEILPTLRKLKGAHRTFTPMYPNFPQEVEDMPEAELHWNALEHYWSLELPKIDKKEKEKIKDILGLEELDLGDNKDFDKIFQTLLTAKSSISPENQQIVLWFLHEYHNTIKDLIPDAIPMKENITLLVNGLVQYTSLGAEALTKLLKTPTDVLRAAVGLSGGDVTLSTPTKFKKLKRAHRKILLGVLESHKGAAAEMVAYKNEWKRLGEALHPGEFKSRFPKTYEAFKAIRSGDKIPTFAGKVEKAFKDKQLETAIKTLSSRPGEFARRLDQTLRNCKSSAEMRKALKEFKAVGEKVAIPVLLQVFAHFKYRGEASVRTAFPKGSTAKVKEISALPSMDKSITKRAAATVRGIIVNKLRKLPTLGNVYIDSEMKNYVVPFSQRSASKALKTIVRGSRLPIDKTYNTLRFFIWWKEAAGNRADIDLSAVSLGENWEYSGDISYYNLRGNHGCHSGDITSAPEGACEFIDINLSTVTNARYIAMMIYSFTGQLLSDLPECFAGWMERKSPKSNEVFDPRTVRNKIDLATKTRAGLPLIIDVKNREIIWTDLGMESRYAGNAFNTKGKLSLTCRAIGEVKKANLYDLFDMHRRARGKTSSKAEADIIFSPDEGITPFDIDKIMADYL